MTGRCQLTTGALSVVLTIAALGAEAAGPVERDQGVVLERISDLTDANSITIVIAGDTGYKKTFPEVGAAIAAHCESVGCHLAVLTGDNFYIPPTTAGPCRAKSKAFDTTFYAPLADLPPGFDVWPVLGNHGYVLWSTLR